MSDDWDETHQRDLEEQAAVARFLNDALFHAQVTVYRRVHGQSGKAFASELVLIARLADAWQGIRNMGTEADWASLGVSDYQQKAQEWSEKRPDENR